MGFDLKTYAARRPALWHLTNRDNLKAIQEGGELLPADMLLVEPVDTPRRGLVKSKSGVVLRDQTLLNERSVEIESGSFADFVRNLNRRVFFWSGGLRAPVRAGRRAAARYRRTDIILRIPFDDVVREHVPEFTQCNSGATRMQDGRRVRRGPSTFQAAELAPFVATKVIEVTFIGSVRLPASTEVWESLDQISGLPFAETS